MLIDVLRHINNFFAVDDGEEGRFAIENEVLTGITNKPIVGQYFAVTGSILNDGVYKAADALITLPDAIDEAWDGTIYRLRIPRDFLRLVKEIEAFENSAEGQPSNITSASFGIQSYSWATTADGMRAGWESVFAKRLNQYRRYTTDIKV